MSRRPIRLPVALAVGAAMMSAEASAELQLEYGGQIQSNVRFRLTEERVGDFYDRRELPVGLDRNENIFELKLRASAERFAGVAHVDLRWIGFSESVGDLSDLSRREKVEPTQFRAHALYLEASDILTDGLDLRVGQQIVAWGVGDQFNPTNNLNPPDLEDPLLFGAQQANLMAKLDYAIGDAVTISGVLVPVFKPALVPASSELAFAAIDRLPLLEGPLRRRILSEAATSRTLGWPTRVNGSAVELPETSGKNMQVGLRVATVIAEQDVALTYYRGFSPFPSPVENMTLQNAGQLCDPADASSCVDGLLETRVTLAYPRIQVAGLDVAGEADLLGWLGDEVHPIGYRLELGVYFPKAQTLTIKQGEINLFGVTRPAGEYAYDLPHGGRPLVMDSTPFAKWTFGLDYTFNRHVYANVQWVHGLIDEIGAGDFFSEAYAVREGDVTSTADETLSCAVLQRNGDACAREILRRKLGDYLVLGLDFRFADDAALVRLFSILDLTGAIEERWSRETGTRVRRTLSPLGAEGFSAVLFPELNYNFGNGLELGAGALVQLGKPYTKFGDPAAGGTILWTRGRFSF